MRMETKNMENLSEYDAPHSDQPLIERWQQELVHLDTLRPIIANKLARYLLIQSGQLPLDFEGTTR